MKKLLIALVHLAFWAIAAAAALTAVWKLHEKEKEKIYLVNDIYH